MVGVIFAATVEMRQCAHEIALPLGMCFLHFVWMRTRLLHLWQVMTTGYWFVPMIMTAVAAIFAFVLLYIDRQVVGKRFDWLYVGGSDGAKTLLSTVAGSGITVAGVVFSITIAALTQASSQFGPRLLRNFMRDTANQVVLGTFVATFVYCLLVLRTIHGKLEDGVAFVPQISVSFAVLLAIASVAVLIYFIHHVSVSLQAPAVVAAVSADLDEAIERLSQQQDGVAVSSANAPGSSNDYSSDRDTAAPYVTATKQGYLQAVDYDGLINIAEESDLVLRLAYRPGDYIIRGTALLYLGPGQRGPGELSEQVNNAFICGRNATAEQNLEHSIHQMVEVAVRALSPGINDPFTAINCIDALGAAICSIARKGLPAPLRYDRQGKLRIVTPVSTFVGVTDAAFNQIRQYGRGSVPVTIRLLEIITTCAGQMVCDAQRQALLHHAEMVYRDSLDVVPQQRDRGDIRGRWETAVRALSASEQN